MIKYDIYIQHDMATISFKDEENEVFNYHTKITDDKMLDRLEETAMAYCYFINKGGSNNEL